MWTHQDSIDIDAPAATIWQLFTDVEGWRQWNAGIADIVLHGPFEVGTRFTMTPPGEEALESTLVEVSPGRGFIDETRVGPNCVRVIHRIRPLEAARCQVDYATEITGPDAADIGAHVTADFPDVLLALKQRAQAA